MKERTELKRNLVISVLITLLGIVFITITYMMLDFRHSSGWSFINTSDNFKVFAYYFVLVIEWGLELFGLILTIFGGIGIYNNARKMQ